MDGAQFSEYGKVRFEWNPFGGAVIYQLEITLPDGKTEVSETFMTMADRFLNMYPQGGTYTWKIVALGHQREILCISGPFSFTKAALLITPEAGKKYKDLFPPPNLGGGGGGGGG